MAEGGDKYKIQIVKTGIGDPFLVVNFKFTEDSLNPIENPVQNVQVYLSISNTMQFTTDTGLGYVLTYKVSDYGPYRVGIPFDRPESWTLEEPLWLQVTIYVNGQFNNVEIVNPDGLEGIETFDSFYAYINLNPQSGATRSYLDEVYYTWPN